MKPKKNKVYCLAIGRTKMLFESQDKADRFIKFNEDEIRDSGTKNFKNLRSYYCEVCGGWHITHINLSESEKQKRDSLVSDVIELATRDTKIKNRATDETIYDFVKRFDLKSFRGKKNFKKYLKENQNLIPPDIQLHKLYRVINELPPESFNPSIPDSNLSEKEVEEKAWKLYNDLPLEKLTDKKMVSEYIKWEYGYKQNIDYKIIIKLKKLCGI